LNIAVLGLGIIGSAWAKNLIDDGNAVRCWNRTPKPFPNFSASIEEAVPDAETIFILVADPPAVQSVLDQIRLQLRPGQLVIQSSTISAEWTLKFAEQVKKTGALFLEAPFTGSKLAAEQRETVYYLGGDTGLIEMARPILEPISTAILHIGPLGSASTLKLAMNMNIAGVGQILCESLTLSRAAGIPDDIYFAALGRNLAHSGLADLKEPKLRPPIFPQAHGQGFASGAGNGGQLLAPARTNSTSQTKLRRGDRCRLEGRRFHRPHPAAPKIVIFGSYVCPPPVARWRRVARALPGRAAK
jgi:3-hydroxyisobutyrate dehydrogenase-like beta-hydroxyacid dehydrogenase